MWLDSKGCFNTAYTLICIDAGLLPGFFVYLNLLNNNIYTDNR